MMRSMYSGVAGLKTHQTKMDVIGNNIANVNTVAYKSQSVTFSELMYQTTQSASGPNATTGTGGVNARQIGLGVKSGAINTNISSQGASQTTNNPFDIMITGDAFFVVNNGQENFFTRDGSFYVDGAGNLAMTSNGYNVMGWGVDPETMDIKADTVQPLRIMAPENLTYPPEATSKAYLSGIIDKNDTNVTSSTGKNINLQFYDSLGYSYTARLNIKSTDAEGVYTLQLNSILDENNEPIAVNGSYSDLLSGANTATVKKETSIKLDDSTYQWKDDGLYLKSDASNATATPKCKKSTIADYIANPTTTMSDVAKSAELQELAKAYGFESIEEMAAYKMECTVPDNNNTASTEDDFVATVGILDILADTADIKGSDGTNEKTQSARAWASVTDLADLNDITATDMEIDGYVITYDPTTGVFDNIAGGDAVTMNLSQIVSGDGSRFSDIEIDFTTTTMYNNSGSSTIAATSGDTDGLGTGRKLGEMSGISIQQNGMIYASYDNGQTKLLGQIAVAEFANASGLEKQGDNLYSATLNSGEFDGIGVDITAGGGYMNTGVLEMSNVDLSAEFTEMITTQRGFQANSRIITVSDTLLEELVNLKR